MTDDGRIWCWGWTGVRLFDCGKELHWHSADSADPAVAIRCLDCRKLFCPACAARHFGRKTTTDH